MDWNQPTLTDQYANFMDSLKSRDFDAISLGFVTITNPQQGMMRYDRTNNKFQEFNGTAWVDKIVSVAGGGTGATTPGGILTNLGLGTIAAQNANNVAITGGTIGGLSSLQVNGATNVNALNATTVASSGNINTSGALGVVGWAYFGQGASFGPGNVNLVGADGRIPNISPTYFADMNGVNLTNLNASQLGVGTVPQARLGSGAVGNGSRVLLDNQTWGDITVVGSSVAEVVHQTASFGTDEDSRQFTIPWSILFPAGPHKVFVHINNPLQDRSAGNFGLMSINVIVNSANTFIINRTFQPGTAGPSGPFTYHYSAFCYR